VRAKLLLCVKFLHACNKLHCGTGTWRHLPNCNDSCDWSSHLWLRAGNPHPSSSMYLMVLACGLRGPTKTWYCSLVMAFHVLGMMYEMRHIQISIQSGLYNRTFPNAINCMHIIVLHMNTMIARTWGWLLSDHHAFIRFAKVNIAHIYYKIAYSY
jgi:hypothetical protein